MRFVRLFFVNVLLALETIISFPVFAIAWLVCAVVFAIVGGFRFAQMENGMYKRIALNEMLGGKANK